MKTGLVLLYPKNGPDLLIYTTFTPINVNKTFCLGDLTYKPIPKIQKNGRIQKQ